MPNKYQLINEMARETLKDITSKPEEWIKFLDTASSNYKYDFNEQVLIYAQKPDATACAEIEIWNKRLKRWVTKGAKGIALISLQDGRNIIRHVFDISDTYSGINKELKLWEVKESYHNGIIETLENSFGDLVIKENLSEAIYSAIQNLVEDNLNDYLKELKEVVKYSSLKDLEENEINNNIENLEEQDDDEYNFNELEGNIIILYHYSEFKNKKLIPQKSLDTLKIMKYFSMENFKTKNEDKYIKNEKKVLNEEIIISEKMNQIYTEYTNEKNLQKYKKYLILPSNILDSSKVIYIPLLGLSNAGKSTILNGLIGFKILPAKKTECTKKGILIRYWEKDYPVMRKTRFMNENNKYYFISEKETIADNIEDIQNILNGLNGKFTDNEEDFFYEIDINIKFVKESDIEDSLKERICFIDLPGFGTNNKFEYLDTYSHLINMCHIFMYVVFNQKIKENDNHKMLNNLYNNMLKEKNIDAKEFIKRCLFIINFDKDQDTSKNTLLQAKKDIIKILPDLNEQYIDDLNLCFFNAKYFENYVLKYKYYNSFEYLIESEHNQYLILQEQLSKGQINSIKGGTFNKFFFNQLKENIKKDIKDKFVEHGTRAELLNLCGLTAENISEKILEVRNGI